MPADIGEGSRLTVVAANDEHAFAEIFERAPLARLADLALVAHDLRRAPEERLLLGLEELGVVVEPAGQAHVVERIGRRLDGFELRRNGKSLAFSVLLRQWWVGWSGAEDSSPVF